MNDNDLAAVPTDGTELTVIYTTVDVDSSKVFAQPMRIVEIEEIQEGYYTNSGLIICGMVQGGSAVHSKLYWRKVAIARGFVVPNGFQPESAMKSQTCGEVSWEDALAGLNLIYNNATSS